MKNLTRISTLFVALLVATPGAHADATQTSLLTEKSSESSVLDSLYLNYFGIFHGPAANNLNAYTLDRNGKPTQMGMFMDGELTAAYLIDRNIGVGPVLPFLASPVLGQGLTMGDAGVKFFNKKTITGKGFNVYTNFIVQGATSEASQKRNLKLGLKTTPNVRYEIPASRFSVGAWTEAKAYLGVTTDKSFKLYSAPYVNYQLIPNLSLNLEYEMEWHHNVTDKDSLDLTAYQNDLQPGFVWNITPHILLNPYLQIYTTKEASADATAIGAVFSATIL